MTRNAPPPAERSDLGRGDGHHSHEHQLPPASRATAPGEPSAGWGDRFRDAMLGAAVGDALGSGVRHQHVADIQREHGPWGVRGYLRPFGEVGAATDLTQLTVFTLEALLRAKAANNDAAWLPTPVVATNQLRWLFTQGVPWQYALGAHLGTHPKPSGWLLDREELFSTRNPAGRPLHAVGRLAQPGEDTPLGAESFPECLVWAAPTMVWSATPEVVYAAGASVANLMTSDPMTIAAAGLHADVLGQLIRGARLWDAVAASSEQRLGRAHGARWSRPVDVTRAINAARFASAGARPVPAQLDVDFDTDGKPGVLGIALASVACTDNFADAVIMAVNHSADSSVAGALAGQLAGAVHGVHALPAPLVDVLELGELIEALCEDAVSAFAPPPLPPWAQRYVNVDAASPRMLGPAEPESAAIPDEAAGTGSPQRYLVDSERVADPSPVRPATDVEGEVSPAEQTLILPVMDFGVDSTPIPAEHVDLPVEDRESTGSWPSPGPATEQSTMDELGDVLPGGSSSIPSDVDESGPLPGESELTPLADEVPLPAHDEVEPEPAAPADQLRGARVPEPATDAAPTEVGRTLADTPEEPLPIVVGGHAAVEDVDEVAPSLTERVLGCFLGGALGDALGADLESASAAQIAERFGPDGPQGLREAFGVHGAITDDTQLTLFGAEGLIRGRIAVREWGASDPIPEVRLAYQRWLHTQGVTWPQAVGAFAESCPEPDGWLVDVPGLFADRAPGTTVPSVLRGFGAGEPVGTVGEPINDSKGCGGVVRAAPFGLWSSDPAQVFELAVRAAAVTHGHPSGHLPAGAFAVIVQQALLGRGLDDGVWLALQVLETWDGHEETSAALAAAVELAERGVPGPELIEQRLGGGWVGEEALAIGVCATLAADGDVALALRIAVHHSGDSDTTGAICGNIVGALSGIAELPMAWLAELEMREVIEQVALDCIAEFGSSAGRGESAEPQPGPGTWPADPASGVDQDWHDRYPVGALWTVRPAEDDAVLDESVLDESAPLDQLPDVDHADVDHADDDRADVDHHDVPHHDDLLHGESPSDDRSVQEQSAADAGFAVADDAEIGFPTEEPPSAAAEVPPLPEAVEPVEPVDPVEPAVEPTTGPRSGWPDAERVTQRLRFDGPDEFFTTEAHPPKPAPRRINGVAPRSAD